MAARSGRQSMLLARSNRQSTVTPPEAEQNDEPENESVPDIMFQRKSTSSHPEAERVLKRIRQHEGVIGVIVVNHENIAVRSTLDHAATQQYIMACRHLIDMSRHVVRDVDPTNDLKYLRVTTRLHELMVAPDQGYIVIVVQKLSGRDPR